MRNGAVCNVFGASVPTNLGEEKSKRTSFMPGTRCTSALK
jgi:hypothetical protein